MNYITMLRASKQIPNPELSIEVQDAIAAAAEHATLSGADDWDLAFLTGIYLVLETGDRSEAAESWLFNRMESAK